MKIAVTSQDASGLGAAVSPHFGRCPFYTLVTLEDGRIVEVEVVSNSGADGHAPGELPAYVKQLGASVILTGGMGRRAAEFFRRMGVEVVGGAGGKVREAVEMYLRGDLRGFSPCSDSENHGDASH